MNSFDVFVIKGFTAEEKLIISVLVSLYSELQMKEIKGIKHFFE